MREQHDEYDYETRHEKIILLRVEQDSPTCKRPGEVPSIAQ
jgi:hypothetical protein